MPEEIHFYKSTDEYGFLSNLYPISVMFGDKTYKSSEHAYQAFKANKDDIKEWIMAAPYPRLAAIAGHGLMSYDIIPTWNKVPLGDDGKPDEKRRHKIVVMRSVLLAKFFFNPALKEGLLDTGSATLIEDSKTDPFWGVGKNGKGQNWLGRCLMDVREIIRKNEEP